MARTDLPNQSQNITPPTEGEPNLGIYNFIDDQGNLTQIKKKLKKRKPEAIEANLEELAIEPTVIGVHEIIPMGCGDINSSTEMAYAIY